MKPTVDLIQLAGLGVNLVIDASQKPTVDIIQIAGIINRQGTHLTLVNAHKKPTVDLIQISGVCKGHLTLDFTDK